MLLQSTLMLSSFQSWKSCPHWPQFLILYSPGGVPVCKSLELTPSIQKRNLFKGYSGEGWRPRVAEVTFLGTVSKAWPQNQPNEMTALCCGCCYCGPTKHYRGLRYHWHPNTIFFSSQDTPHNHCSLKSQNLCSHPPKRKIKDSSKSLFHKLFISKQMFNMGVSGQCCVGHVLASQL